MNINKIICTGRRRGRLRNVSEEMKVCQLRLAVDGMGRGRELGDVNVAVFGRGCQACASSPRRGLGWVGVDGRLEFGQWETEGGEKRHDYSAGRQRRVPHRPETRLGPGAVNWPATAGRPSPRERMRPAPDGWGTQLLKSSRGVRRSSGSANTSTPDLARRTVPAPASTATAWISTIRERDIWLWPSLTSDSAGVETISLRATGERRALETIGYNRSTREVAGWSQNRIARESGALRLAGSPTGHLQWRRRVRRTGSGSDR